jgi:hypothetical protein
VSPVKTVAAEAAPNGATIASAIKIRFVIDSAPTVIACCRCQKKSKYQHYAQITQESHMMQSGCLEIRRGFVGSTNDRLGDEKLTEKLLSPLAPVRSILPV